MIIYDLNCENNHHFEGWFQNASAFENQLEGKLVCCPKCDSHKIRRVPSAVMISSHQCEPNKTSPVQSSTSGSTALMPVGAQAMAIYRQLIDAIATQSEDVGTSFAEEARKIHYNEAPERPIRGEATVDECEALRDEGINVLQLPLLKSEDLN
jgi:hypothetical protein